MNKYVIKDELINLIDKKIKIPKKDTSYQLDMIAVKCFAKELIEKIFINVIDTDDYYDIIEICDDYEIEMYGYREIASKNCNKRLFDCGVKASIIIRNYIIKKYC